MVPSEDLTQGSHSSMQRTYSGTSSEEEIPSPHSLTTKMISSTDSEAWVWVWAEAELVPEAKGVANRIDNSREAHSMIHSRTMTFSTVMVDSEVVAPLEVWAE